MFNYVNHIFFFFSSEKMTSFLIPIRCYTCNSVIEPKIRNMQKEMQLNPDQDINVLAKQFKLNRACCRRMYLATVLQPITYYHYSSE